MTIKIVTDSTCDLPPNIADKYGITVIPCYINIGNNSYLDGVELSRKTFYDKLPELSSLPTTSAPGTGTFVKCYHKLIQEGAEGIISLHISKSLSNIANFAKLAADSIDDVPIAVIDSGQLTLGTGILAIEAAKATQNALSIEEITALVEKKKNSTHSFALLNTLDYLRKGGRVSHLQYKMGAILEIKPLLKIQNGIMSMDRIRTWKKALANMVNQVRELAPFEHLSFVHANALEKAMNLQNILQDITPKNYDPIFGEVTPAIGAHVGPGSIGIVCIRKDNF